MAHKCRICGRNTIRNSDYCIFHYGLQFEDDEQIASRLEDIEEGFIEEFRKYAEEVKNSKEKILNCYKFVFPAFDPAQWNKLWEPFGANPALDYTSVDFEKLGVSVKFTEAKFLGDINFVGSRFGDGALFDNAEFRGSVNFARSRFGVRIFFDEAKFFNYVSFIESSFKNEVSFIKAEFYDSIDFIRSRMGDQASFDGVKFYRKSNFNGVSFGYGALFAKAEFYGKVDFSWSHFGDRGVFSESEFHDEVYFTASKFGNRMLFLKIKFHNVVFFDWNSFGNGTSFINAKFGGKSSFTRSIFGNGTLFDKAEFRDYAIFNTVSFGKNTSFLKTKFYKKTDFSGANFDVGTLLLDAEFHDAINFEKSRFNGRVVFDRAKFNDKVSFNSTDFGDKVSFIKSEFHGIVDFSGSRFGDEISFSRAKFNIEEQEINFNGSKFGNKVFFIETEFHTKINFTASQFGYRTFFSRTIFLKGADFSFSSGGSLEFYIYDSKQISDTVLLQNIVDGKIRISVGRNIDVQDALLRFRFDGTNFIHGTPRVFIEKKDKDGNFQPAWDLWPPRPGVRSKTNKKWFKRLKGLVRSWGIREVERVYRQVRLIMEYNGRFSDAGSLYMVEMFLRTNGILSPELSDTLYKTLFLRRWAGYLAVLKIIPVLLAFSIFQAFSGHFLASAGAFVLSLLLSTPLILFLYRFRRYLFGRFFRFLEFLMHIYYGLVSKWGEDVVRPIGLLVLVSIAFGITVPFVSGELLLRFDGSSFVNTVLVMCKHAFQSFRLMVFPFMRFDDYSKMSFIDFLLRLYGVVFIALFVLALKRKFSRVPSQ